MNTRLLILVALAVALLATLLGSGAPTTEQRRSPVEAEASHERAPDSLKPPQEPLDDLSRAAVPAADDSHENEVPKPRKRRGKRDRETSSVRGRVIDDLGNPVDDVLVDFATVALDWSGDSADYLRKRTDEAGEFWRRGLDVGRWRVWATDDSGSASPTIKIDVRLRVVDEIELVLPRPAHVRGMVLGPDGLGRSAELLRFIAPSLDEYEDADWTSVGESSSNGAFEVRIPPGSTRLLARGGELSPSDVIELTVDPGEEVTGTVLRLRTGATVEIKILDSDGIPAVDFDVGLRELEARYEEHVRTDSLGIAIFGRVPAGKFKADVGDRVEIGHGDYRPTLCRREFALENGEQKQVSMQLPKTDAVEVFGRVSPRGMMMSASLLFEEVEGERLAVAGFGREGEYATILPAPGMYDVTFREPDLCSWFSRRVDVPDTRSLHLDLPLGRGYAGGRVWDARGRAREGVRVSGSTAEGEYEGGGWSVTDENGNYWLELPAGVGSVVVDAFSEFAAAIRPIVLGDGDRLRGVNIELRLANPNAE